MKNDIKESSGYCKEYFHGSFGNTLSDLILDYRSSRSNVLKKCVLKNLAIFPGRHLCWSLLLIKLQAFRPKRLQSRCFPVNIAKFLRLAF